MQSHIIKRLETFLEEHDRRLIGWDEILEGGLPPQATVMSWQGTEGGLAAASAGHDVIMSPVGYLYLDYLQTASPNEPPGRPTQVNLGKLYNFEPVPAELAADKRGHILGLQANMFTEHTRSYARLQHNLFPRLAAVAETGWSTPEHRDSAIPRAPAVPAAALPCLGPGLCADSVRSGRGLHRQSRGQHGDGVAGQSAGL